MSVPHADGAIANFSWGFAGLLDKVHKDKHVRFLEFFVDPALGQRIMESDVRNLFGGATSHEPRAIRVLTTEGELLAFANIRAGELFLEPLRTGLKLERFGPTGRIWNRLGSIAKPIVWVSRFIIYYPPQGDLGVGTDLVC